MKQIKINEIIVADDKTYLNNYITTKTNHHKIGMLSTQNEA